MAGLDVVRQGARDSGSLTWYVLCRFNKDGCLSSAAALSYTTLLAMVPLLALALGILTGFPGFEDVHVRIQSFVLRNLVPQAGQAVTSALTSFIENAGRATGVGIIGLAFTSIMLFATINSAFNQIWRVERERPILWRVVVYWAIISLGPMLFGAALSLSGTIFGEITGARGMRKLISWLLPLVIEIVAFSLLYAITPNRPVRWRHAWLAGLVAALLFELLKAGYGSYLRQFPTYQSIYGALSAIPIFLLWMYLCWAVTLFGAEVAAALPEWQSANALKEPERDPRPGERLTLAMVLLNRMLESSRAQGPIPQQDLIDGLAAPMKWVDCELQALNNGGFIERTERGDWVLARDLDELTVGDLYRGLELTPSPADAAPSTPLAPAADWPERLYKILAEVKEAEREVMRVPVKRLLMHRKEEPIAAARQRVAGG
jgi:membrane protein